MTTPPAAPGRETTKQLLLAALTESALMLSILVLHFAPAELAFLAVAAVLLVVGLALAVYTIYRAVRLMVTPATKTVAYVSIAIVVGGPLVLWAVLQFV